MARNDQPEMLIPVSDTSAALQFFVEAMKQNTAVLKGLQAEQRETLKTVNDTRERVIKLEGGGARVVDLKTEIAALRVEVTDLKRERDRRGGAVDAFEWLSRFGPWLLALALGVLAFMGWERVE